MTSVMNNSLKVSALTVLLPLSAVAAQAAAPGQRDDDARAFTGAPVGDELLARTVGGQRLPFGGAVRGVTDATTSVLMQQVGQTGRIQMDNWWAQTGAALIANNLLAAQIR